MTNSEPSKSSEDGVRDPATGRFVPGHPGITPGRPSRETERAYLEVFKQTIGPDELEAVLRKLLALALAGDTRACEIILKRTVPEKQLVEMLLHEDKEAPFDVLAAYANDPGLMERALQLERDMYNAQGELRAGSDGQAPIMTPPLTFNEDPEHEYDARSGTGEDTP